MGQGKEKVGRRQYIEEFQLDAVRLADSAGLGAAADRPGVPRATVGNWTRRRCEAGHPAGGAAMAVAMLPGASTLKRPTAELEGEVARLRRVLASLKLDNETLRRAAAYSTGGSR